VIEIDQGVQGAKGLTVHMACGRLYACFVVGGWLSARLSIALWVAASTWPWSASASFRPSTVSMVDDWTSWAWREGMLID
jgi:hypothetical protein